METKKTKIEVGSGIVRITKREHLRAIRHLFILVTLTTEREIKRDVDREKWEERETKE